MLPCPGADDLLNFANGNESLISYCSVSLRVHTVAHEFLMADDVFQSLLKNNRGELYEKEISTTRRNL